MMLIRSAGLPFARLEALAASWETAEKALQVGQASLNDHAQKLQTAFDAALPACTDPLLRTAVYNTRRDFFQRRRLPAPPLETHLSQRSELATLVQAIQNYRQAEAELLAAEASYTAHFEAAMAGAYRQLQDIAREPEFQRALLFSSHTLLEQLPRFAETPVARFAKKERQTALAVLQYTTRMATKTTPLSRFATVSLDWIADEPGTAEPLPDMGDDAPDAPDFSKHIVTPNVALLEALYAVLLYDPTFIRALPLALNPCIAGVEKDAYRWLFFNGEQESFQEAEANPLLDFVAGLLLENQRQMPFEKFVETIVATSDLERDLTEAYLIQLVDVGFLEWVLPEPGLSADWCSNLYRFLGFLPAEPLIVDAAALLQWLRTTARMLAHLPSSEAAIAQRDAAEQVHLFFERWEAPVPPIPPEQLFYEDVAGGASCTGEEKNTLPNQLADAWRDRPKKPLPPQRAAFVSFVLEKTTAGQATGFLELARAFLEKEKHTPVAPLPHPVPQAETPEIVGALLQVFQENGRPCAVVNALYPGGGKMFARWLHLFPPHAGQTLRDRQTQNSTPKDQHSSLSFPWQGYFNANFQPALAADSLSVPGGRVRPGPGGRTFLLGNIDVIAENGVPILRDRTSGQRIHLTDFGLEAPETKPPVMRLLWQLGVPYVSLDALLPENRPTQLLPDGVLFRPRFCQGDLVLARAAWTVPQEFWQTQFAQHPASPAEFFRKIRKTLAMLGVPRHFFARFATENAQAFDQDNPLSMALFQKIMQRGTGVLHLSEMLPMPDGRATEIVVEIVV